MTLNTGVLRVVARGARAAGESVLISPDEADALADLIDAVSGLLEALEPIDSTVLGTGACAAYDYTSHLLEELAGQ